jgi:hypothetical protein
MGLSRRTAITDTASSIIAYHYTTAGTVTATLVVRDGHRNLDRHAAVVACTDCRRWRSDATDTQTPTVADANLADSARNVELDRTGPLRDACTGSVMSTCIDPTRNFSSNLPIVHKLHFIGAIQALGAPSKEGMRTLASA